ERAGAAAEARRVLAGGQQSLGDPGRRLSVRLERLAGREAAVRPLFLAQVVERAVGGLRAGGQDLQHRTGDVGGAGALRVVAPAAVLRLHLAQPFDRRFGGAVGPRRAQGQDRVGAGPGPPLVGAVVAAFGQQARDEVFADEVARVDPRGLQGEDRAGDVAGVLDLAAVRAEEVDRGLAAVDDVERIFARRGEGQHRPGGHFRPRVATAVGGEAAAGALL